MKKSILLALLAIALAASVCSFSSCMKSKESPVNTNTASENTVTDGSNAEPDKGHNPNMAKYHYGSFDYWFCPPDAANDDLPLIVYLHDGSDGGSGIDSMIQKDGIAKALYENALQVNAYVLIPNLSNTNSSWHDMRTQLQELISYVTTSIGLDASKVYLTGVGKGATGVYEIAASMPTAFAAFAPIGGEISASVSAESLKDAKLLAYVSIDLEDAGAESIMDFMFELGQINSAVEIFVLENYNRSNYVNLYVDSEYNPLQALIGN